LRTLSLQAVISVAEKTGLVNLFLSQRKSGLGKE
jgi:hypothetical protein